MRLRRVLALLLYLFLLPRLGVAASATTAKQLPQYYRQWITEDVPYIINEDEKREFLRLKTDIERDHFIEAFWESRNPDPHATINTFKEEHFRRLAYVKEQFGDSRYNDGWRTDMGRIYITLGPPKQRAPYHVGINTRPVEIWFYQSTSPALPAFFNLVFYKRGDSDPYTLYSPREDGPTRIVTNDAHGTGAADALKVIQQSMGEEAAHAMVSLYPGEPVNLKDPDPSLDSDFLLEAVRNLPDQKLEKQRIESMRHVREEKVTSSIFTGANATSLETAILRDDQGRQTAHFLLRNQQIDPRIIGTLPNKQTGYSMSLQTRVMTADGKAVYQQQDTLQGVVSVAGAAAARTKLFAAEGRLPLVPGTYDVEATLTNNLTHEATRASRKVTVPTVHADTIGMSDLVPFAMPSPTADPGGQLPFSVSKLRFNPRGPQIVQIHIGDKLPLMYQLWFPLADLKGADQSTAKTVHVHYIVGAINGSASGREPLEENEDVEVKNLDTAGNLLTGRTVDTSRLGQGTYRLVAKVTEAGTPRSAFATLTIKVLPPEVTIPIWTAFGPESSHPAWQEDAQRGVAAEVLGNNAEAAACYHRALAIKPDSTDIQARLQALTKKETAHNTNIK